MIENCNNHQVNGGRALLSTLVLETSNILDINSILDQLQRSTKAVKFWYGDNDITNCETQCTWR